MDSQLEGRPVSPRPRQVRARGVAGGLSEAVWQDHVLALATAYQWRSYHTHDSRRSNPGFPDLVLLRPPELLFVELKTDTGRIRPEQKSWLDELDVVALAIASWTDHAGDEGAAGPNDPADRPVVQAYVWRPRDFDAVHARLARGRRQTPMPAPDALGDW
jgi:hypothetical protein